MLAGNNGFGLESNSRPRNDGAVLQALLKERDSEFIQSKCLTLLVATWNVNGNLPKESLSSWLLHPEPLNYPHIIVCGLQEMDLSVSALILSETSRAEEWIDAISNTLNRAPPKMSYTLLGKQQLGGISQTLWVRNDVECNVRNIETKCVSTGIGNLLGNKGGTAIRFTFYDSSFCFVCGHLNAHDDNVIRRNEDYAAISKGIIFKDSNCIWDHDFIFWFGDLNYRIELDRDKILDLIRSNDWYELLTGDQLRMQQRLGNAFTEFVEGDICWAPTYRFNPGSSCYDTSEKMRKPSYTDRILHKKCEKLTLVGYNHIPEIETSDHKPVVAFYLADAKKYIPAEYSKSAMSLKTDLDNSRLPHAIVSNSDIQFGMVQKGAVEERLFSIQNIGMFPFEWQFRPKLDQNICEPWVKLIPLHGMLLPGQSQTISVVVCISLEFEPAMLEDILVVHLEHGRDFFVSLSCVVAQGIK